MTGFATTDASTRHEPQTGTRSLPAVGERLADLPLRPFTAADLAAYADASGDNNPLHLDPAVARQAGFAAPLVHGMLLLAAIEPTLSAWRPDLRVARLGAKFVQPLLVGEASQVGARVVRHADGGALLRVTVQGPGRAPSLLGEALLVPKVAS